MRPALHFALYRLGLLPPETQTSSAERACIVRHASGKTTAAEIGVWHGVTTCRIAESLKSSGVVYAIDNYLPGRLGVSFPYQVASWNTRRWRDRINFIRATGTEAAAHLKEIPGPVFDFVFIDGDHSYRGLEADWEAWSPLLRSSGIVALHDSRSTASRNLETAGSCIFTQQIVARDKRFDIVEEVDTLTVLQRK